MQASAALGERCSQLGLIRGHDALNDRGADVPAPADSLQGQSSEVWLPPHMLGSPAMDTTARMHPDVMGQYSMRPTFILVAALNLKTESIITAVPWLCRDTVAGKIAAAVVAAIESCRTRCDLVPSDPEN
jgi:hypothetical protein